MRTSVLRSRLLSGAAVAAAIAIAVLLPTVAFAATGDYMNPSPVSALPWSQDATGTLIHGQVSFAGHTIDYYEYNYLMPMKRGQTVTFTSTMQDEDSYMLMMPWNFPSPMVVSSVNAGVGVQQLIFMAPRDGSYELAVDGSQVDTFSVSATVTPSPVNYKLASLSVPKNAKKNKSFTVSAGIGPGYDSVFSPVSFVVKRKVGTKFKAFKTFGSSASGGDENANEFSASLKLAKGTYQVTATFSDATHTKVKPLGPKTVTVK